MLRFWPEQQSGETVWRFTLVDPQTNKRHSFASLETLNEYLKSITREESLTSSDAG